MIKICLPGGVEKKKEGRKEREEEKIQRRKIGQYGGIRSKKD